MRPPNGNIIRVLNPEGKGLYRSFKLGNETVSISTVRSMFIDMFPEEKENVWNYRNHPCPSEDEKLIRSVPLSHKILHSYSGNVNWHNEEFLFGFRDKNQALSWLGNSNLFLEYLSTLGFSFSILSGVCYYGNKQAIIHGPSAIQISTHPLTDLLK